MILLYTLVVQLNHYVMAKHRYDSMKRPYNVTFFINILMIGILGI